MKDSRGWDKMDKSSIETLSGLCSYLEIGEMTKDPEYLQGGFLHRMAKVTTVKGIFAVKSAEP